MAKRKTYWHISMTKNLKSILSNGITANENNEIFLFEDMILKNPSSGKTAMIVDLIAYDQLFVKEYLLFEIKPNGINGEIINDDVAEIGKKYQWILKQEKIEPKFLIYHGQHNTIKPDLFDYGI